MSRSILLSGFAILLLYSVLDSRKDPETKTYMAGLILCMFLVCFARTDFSQIKSLLRVLSIAGIVLSIYVCLMRFFPGGYQIILRALPQSVREYNVSVIAQGYGVPVGGSIVYADYMISMVLIAFLSISLSGQEHFIFRGNNKVKLWAAVIVMLLAMIFEERRGEPICPFDCCAFCFNKRGKRIDKVKKAKLPE